MIASLRGRVLSSDEKQVILETGGVGFCVSISGRDAVNIPPVGEEVFLYTYMSVREDEIALFGFLDRDDLAIYKNLISVSGIGPKAGLGILSAMSAAEIRVAVVAEDAKSIAKAPGIGPKTAKKLILELKDKIDASDLAGMLEADGSGGEDDPAFRAAKEEALQVLTALGFSRSEALQAIRGASLTPDMDSDQIINAALRDKK